MANTETLIAVVEARLASFEGEMRRMTSIIENQAKRANSANASMEKGFKSLTNAVRGFYAAVATGVIAKFASEAVQASNQMTALNNAFKTITGSTKEAGQAIEFVRAESRRLGLDFSSAAKSFQGLAASARGTALEGEATREAFLAVAEAGRVLGLSTDQMQGSLIALQQIISKGTVASEELRGQLSERLPGAFQIAARAMGVTTAQLSKMLEQGQVISTEFIPKFSRQLRLELAGGVSEAARTFQAETARMGNAWFEFLAKVGDAITQSPEALKFIQTLTEGLEALTAVAPGVSELVNMVFTQLNAKIAETKETLDTLGKSRFNQFLQELGEIFDNVDRKITAFNQTLDRLLENMQREFAEVTGLPNPLEKLMEAADPSVRAVQEVQKAIGALRKEQEELRTKIETGDQQGVVERFLFGRYPDKGALEQRLAFVSSEIQRLEEQLATLERRARKPLTAEDLRDPMAVAPAVKPLFAQEAELARGSLETVRAEMERIQRLRKLGLSDVEALTQQEKFLEKTVKDVLTALSKKPGILAALPPEIRKSVEEMERLHVKSQANLESAKEREKVEKELRALRTQGPESVREARELEAKIAALRQIIPTLQESQRALAAFDLRQLEDKLVSLRNQGLAPSVQQARELVVEIGRLRDSLATAPVKEKFLIEFDIHEAEEQLRTFYNRHLPASVQAVKNLEAEIAHLQDIMNNQALELGPVGFEQIRKQLSDFQDQYSELTMTLEQRIAFQGLEEFGNAMANLEGDTKEGNEAAKDFLENQYELNKALARSAAEAEAFFKKYLEGLRRIPDSQKDVEDAIVKRTKELVEDQEKAAREQERLYRELGRNAVDAVEAIFLAIDVGSDKTEKKILNLVRTFTNVLQVLARQAQATNLTINAGEQGQPGAGTTAQEVSGNVMSGTAGVAYRQYQAGNYAGAAGSAFSSLGAGVGLYTALVPYTQMLAQYDPGTILARELFGQRAGQRVANISGGITAGAVGGFAAGGVYGAIIGAVVGGIIGGLKKIPKRRSIEVDALRIPRAIEDQAGVFINDVVTVIERHKNVSEELQQRFQTGVQDSVEEFLGQVQSILDIAPDDIAQAARPAVNELLGQVEDFITGIGIGPVKDISDEIEELLQNLTPALQAEFQDVLDMLGRVADITSGIDAAIRTVEDRQRAIVASLRGQRQAIGEALLSPAALFVKRQQELGRAMDVFRASTGAERVALVPQIQSLIDEIFRLAQHEDVIGGDIASLAELQGNLSDILTQVERDTSRALENQIDALQHQRDIFMSQLDSLNALRGITEQQFRQANSLLERIADFLETRSPVVGSFQEGGIVPQTGLALVHRGEMVIPPMYTNRPGNGFGAYASDESIHVTVNVQGSLAPGQEKALVADLRDMLSQLRRETRLGKSGLALSQTRNRHVQTTLQTPTRMRRS